MTREDIARTAHEVNRAYCLSLGDTSQPAWENAPQWQRDSAIAGVTFHEKNPDAGAYASHESWMAEKLAQGWTYGPKKDAHLKQHHCLVPFDELPKEQQAKDFLFRGTVHSLLKHLDVPSEDYACVYLQDGAMPGTFKSEIKFGDSNVYNPRCWSHIHGRLLGDHLASVCQKLDPETLTPYDLPPEALIELPSPSKMDN